LGATGTDDSILTSCIIITLSWDVPWPGRIGSVCGIPPPGRGSGPRLTAGGFSGTH